MTNQEAMKLALDEFKHIKQWCLRSIGIGLVNENVLTALEEALAKQEQCEPVAIQTERASFRALLEEIQDKSFGCTTEDYQRGMFRGVTNALQIMNTKINRGTWVNSYPLPNQPSGWLDENGKGEATTDPKRYGSHGVAFYTTPQQRTWVGLTDEEIEMIVENKRAAHWEFIRQVEAKLKEKNT